MASLLSILIGMLAGIFSGFVGVGGAIIIIPLLVYLFKFPQHLAQGTALTALLLPVGILAVIKYYHAGNTNIKIGLLIGLGFFMGSFIGANFAHLVPSIVLKKLFAILLFCISMYMLLGK
jgi:uncharacterized membrane protein YfcA